MISERILNPIIGSINVNWASSVLQVPPNPIRTGPDLMDRNKFVEVKSGYSTGSWTFVNEQIMYQSLYPDLKGFILFVLYFPHIRAGVLKEGDLPNIGKMITERESYLVPFGWLNQFKTKEGKHSCVA